MPCFQMYLLWYGGHLFQVLQKSSTVQYQGLYQKFSRVGWRKILLYLSISLWFHSKKGTGISCKEKIRKENFQMCTSLLIITKLFLSPNLFSSSNLIIWWFQKERNPSPATTKIFLAKHFLARCPALCPKTVHSFKTAFNWFWRIF